MIFASRLARRTGLPFDVEKGIKTEGEGQVKGLSKQSVQAILSGYGMTRVLAEEGGRTSRGSLGNIRIFLEFLNALHADSSIDCACVEAWWVAPKLLSSLTPSHLRFVLKRAARCGSCFVTCWLRPKSAKVKALEPCLSVPCCNI